jgi:hypothetical protein
MDDESAFAAFVGRNWDHYRHAFTGARRFNWAAALAPFWLMYRGFWLLQLGAVFAFLGLMSWLAMKLPQTTSGQICAPLLAWAILGCVQGASGDALVQGRARRAIAKVRTRGLSDEEALKTLRRKGDVPYTGIALVLLLAVVGGMWSLVTVFGHDHDAIPRAAMKADLRNLVYAEEAYFAAAATYTRTLPDTFALTEGVSIGVETATKDGWTATASHKNSDSNCRIFVGTIPHARGMKEGLPVCS